MIRIKTTSLFVILLAVPLVFALKMTFAQSSPPIKRVTSSFDNEWLFAKGELNGAEQPKYNDKTWRMVDVPHDWTIEEPVGRENPTGRGGGYFPANVGWYRKTFNLPESYKDKKVYIEFDGIMANSDVWVNGHHLGNRPFGYVSFRYDLTPYLNHGKKKTNTIAVRANNLAQPASRWYTGAGIYRHVRLIVTSAIALEQWGTFITTPEVDKEKAVVKVQAKVSNRSKEKKSITVNTSIMAPDGQVVKNIKETKVIDPEESIDFEGECLIEKPLLWGLETPHLYKAHTKVLSEQDLLDDEINTFGIRSIRFEATTGFYLNDINMKIKGACLHHDGGALGAAVPLRIWEKRLELLREIGVNAIRTSHNPFAPEFYDLCDRMGFLVMNETFDTWTARKNNANYGYQVYFKDWWEKDTRDVVLRDRNHPSIFIYSVGNEIRDNLNNEKGFKTFTDQRDLIKSLDPTRPVTLALFRPNQANVYSNGFVELMDVVGQNYRENELVQAHLDKPERKVLGTENAHTREAWLILRDNPFMSGQFLWTGFDYLGEADWPEISHDYGVFDRNGGTKPRTYERQSWWSLTPMAHISRREGNGGVGDLVSDWTPADYDTYDEAHVTVFSNCDEVELFINGKSLGSKSKPSDDSPRNWKLTFEKGAISAIGRNKGLEVAAHELHTADEPSRIMLSADKTHLAHHWDDVIAIKAILVDENGVTCVNSSNKVSFEIEGPGQIVAIDNGDRTSHEPFQAHERRTHRGECIAYIKATEGSGKIIIKASSPEIQAGTIDLNIVTPSAGK